MRFTFHKTLFKLGNMRFGIGYTSRNNPLAWSLLFFILMFKFVWYMIIGMLWMCYGMFILMYYMMKYLCIGLYLFYKWCLVKPIMWIVQKIKQLLKNKQTTAQS